MTEATLYDAPTEQDHFKAPPLRRFGALGFVRNEAGQVLLCEKGNVAGARRWTHPGGCAERNEDLEAALVRIARAKLGVVLAPGRLLVTHHMFDREHVDSETGEAYVSREGMNWVFDCGTIPGDTVFTFGGSIVGARWFDWEELRDELRPFMAERTLAAYRALEYGGVMRLKGHPGGASG